jgi:cation transport regulator ChaB
MFHQVLGGQEDSLPKQARDIYEEVYSSAWENYQHEATRRDNSSQEEIACRLAWAAVEQLYQRDKATGQWLKCQWRDGTVYGNPEYDNPRQSSSQNF